MKPIEETILIYAPMDQVFTALADPQNQMKFDREILRSYQKLDDGPIDKGTRFRGEFKGIGRVEYEYAEFKKNQLIERAVKMPFGSMRHIFLFEPTTGGVRLTQSIIPEHNLFANILWLLLIRNVVKKWIRKLNVLLKNYAEGLIP